MFDNDYLLTGKHAKFTRFMKEDARIFETNVDIYLNGAIFGLLYNKHAKKDTGTDKTNILASAFINRQSECKFLYRLVMLLQQVTNETPEEKIERAFRDDADPEQADRLKENLEIFNSYVRGGIEVLYDQFVEGNSTNDDYFEEAFDQIEAFYKHNKRANFEEEIVDLIG